MITKPTVLILGAGSNAEYGFPSGGQLIEEVISLTEEMQRSNPSPFLEEFTQRLKGSEPRSIDSWLEYEGNFNAYGKLALSLIALCIMKKENESIERLRGGLYQEIWNCLKEGCREPEGLKHNKLSIVTFNYDRSLEHYLFTTACQFWKGKHEAEIARWLNSGLEIIHVYGHIGFLPWQAKPKDAVAPVQVYDTIPNRELADRCSTGIRLIPQGREETPELARAQLLLSDALAIYLIGFGYNQVNCQRLHPKTWRAAEIRGSWWDSGTSDIPDWVKNQLHDKGEFYRANALTFARTYATGLHMPIYDSTWTAEHNKNLTRLAKSLNEG